MMRRGQDHCGVGWRIILRFRNFDLRILSPKLNQYFLNQRMGYIEALLNLLIISLGLKEKKHYDTRVNIIFHP